MLVSILEKNILMEVKMRSKIVFAFVFLILGIGGVSAGDVYLFSGDVNDSVLNIEGISYLGDSLEYEEDNFTGAYSVVFLENGQEVKENEFYLWEGLNVFLFSVKVPDGIDEIVFEENENEIHRVVISQNAPSIDSFDVVDNSGVFDLSWIASDLDGDDLGYSVYISHEGGGWGLYSSGIEENNLIVNNNYNGDLRFKLRASDGFNYAEAVSGSFSVEGFPGFVSIENPKEGLYAFGEGIELIGKAFDYNFNLIGDDYNWHSDIGGFLSTGNNILIDTLTMGVHSISLAVSHLGIIDLGRVDIEIVEACNDADVNEDTVVDVSDLAVVGGQWGTDGEANELGFSGDITGDAIVDIGDLGALGFNWGSSTGTCA